MYRDRICDAALEEYLGTFGAVLVEGPKWCGKTTTAARAARSEFLIADPALGYQNRRLAEVDAGLALEGERPRLLDEWQEVPALWDAVRYACDAAQGAPGQFLLTGSATPREAGRPLHSGAGRIGRLRMDTMTLCERGLATSFNTLGTLFDGQPACGVSALSLADLAEVLCRGGWPGALDASTKQAMLLARGYIEAVAAEDIGRVDGVARNPDRVMRLIRSLSRNEATLASLKTVAVDTAGSEGRPLSTVTVAGYLEALEKMFFIDDVPAWNPALRSPVRIRAAKKRHLADPSLAVAALGASPETLMQDLKTTGFLFESLVTHDLKVYARAIDARVMHYRDDSGLEVDLIIQKANGDWGAVEVKLSSQQEDAAAASLLALDRKMTERGERPCSFKAVIVGVGGVGRTRDDRVAVVPITALGA